MRSFSELSYGDEIRYVGDAEPPTEMHQPYRFCYVSHGGTLKCHTRFNANRYLAPDHPANDPADWERVDA